MATGFTGSETVALASNPGSSTLGGTLTVSATSGVASFSGLNLNKVGSGYTLAITSGTLTSATSSAISVAPGTATQLLITTQPASMVTAGTGFGFTVTAEDAEGNLATGFTGSETVALASNPGSSTLGGTLTVSAASGIATFSGLTLNKVGSGYTLAVTGGTLTSATSSAVSVTPGTATQLLITAQPASMVTAGAGFGFTVTAEDAQGNVATGFTGSETVALASNPGSSTLGGTLTVSATNGIATFSGLTLNKAGSGYTLAITSGTLTSATSSAISVTAGTATQLLITTQPASTVTAGTGFGFTVTAEDAEGNVATGFTGSETVALASNPGSSTLGGTLTVSASSGVATFSGLTLNKVGSGYTLASTSGTLASATSSAISVAPGTATQLLITTQPASTVTAGAGFGFTVTAEDAEGNVATGFTGSETVALASNPGSSTLGGTLTVSAASGVASFSGLTLNKVGSGYTLAATSGTLTSATSNAISVIAGTATQLLITTQPASTVTAGAGFSFTVTAEDAQGNVATGFTGSETVALASNPGSSTLGGTLTVSAASGVASFSGLTLNKVGSGYTLAVTSGTLTSTTSSAISVTPGTATQLLITTQPASTVTAGVGFGFTVTAEDAEGNVATGFTGSETVALASNPGSSTLGGTLTVSAASGIATFSAFSGLTLNKAGSGYTLKVTSGTLTSATSGAISVTAGTATQLLITTQPSSTVTAGAGFGFTVTAEDAQGNVATGFTGSESVALASGPMGGTLGGTLSVSASSGVATFSGLTLSEVGSGYTLAVTSSTLASVTSSAISVTAAAATRLLITTQPPSTDTAGAGFGFTVTAEDSQGNMVAGFTGSETVALASGPTGGTLGGTLIVSATNGVATFSGLTLNKVGSGYTLAVSSGTLTSATSSPISVTPGAATQLLVTTQPAATVTAGAGFGFTVTAEDAEGNTATSFNGSETVALANNPGGSTLSGTLTVTATNGLASFTGLALNRAGSGYSVAIASGTLASATSSPISVTPGGATQLVITTQPPSTVTAGSGFGLTVTAEDAEGNTATSFSGGQTIVLANNPGGSGLGGTSVAVSTGGVATFSGLTLNKVGSGYSLAVTSGTLTSVTSSAISVAPGAATQLLITSQPPASVTAGVGFGLTVTAKDAQGNVATGFSGNETVALANNPGGSTLGGTLTVAAASGLATFSGLTLNKADAGYLLSLSSGALSPATSSAITVLPPPPPVLALNSPATNYSTGFQPQSGSVAIENTTGVTISDITTMAGASIVITNLEDGANESLTASSLASGLTSSYNSANGTLSISGTSTVANYVQALESITYNDVAASPNATTRNIQFTVTDSNGLKSNVAVSTVSVNGTYTEASGPGSTQAPNVDTANPIIVIDSGDVVTATTVTSATVAISSGFVSSTEDVLALSSQFGQNFGITLSYPVAGEIVLTGTVATTPSEYELELRSITYQNTSHYFSPSDLLKTFTFTLYNGTAYSTSDIKSYNIVQVDTNPTVTTTTGVDSFAALAGRQPIDPGVTITDPDSANILAATVSISSGYFSGQDMLSETATLPAGVTSVFNSVSGA